MKARYIVIIVIIVLLTMMSIFIAGELGGEDTMTYKQISMEEAKHIFESGIEDSYIILDVRRADEFANGHIPGAINVANESLEECLR